MNPRQAQFVAEYLIDGIPTQAAIRAGYSPTTAAVTGHRLLRNANVVTAIATGREIVAERTALTQDEVIAGLRREANLYGDDASHGARVTAWAKLGEHLGMFKQVIETTHRHYREAIDETRRDLRLVA